MLNNKLKFCDVIIVTKNIHHKPGAHCTVEFDYSAVVFQFKKKKGLLH